MSRSLSVTSPAVSGNSVLAFLVSAMCCCSFVTQTASCSFGHDEFKEVLEKRYRLRSVSCKACHTDNKDKKIRNAFGKLLFQELKAKKLTERYIEAKEEGDKAKEKFEKTMLKEFEKALKKIEEKPVTFLALLEAGLLNGTRLDKELVDADSLTIKTLSDAEVEAVKVENSHLIEGEIKEMPPEQKTAPDEKQAEPEAGNPVPAETAPKSKPTAKSNDSESAPKPSDSVPPSNSPKPE